MNQRAKIRLAILAALIALGLVAQFFVRVHIVFGESMAPTLKSWDLCVMRVVRDFVPQRGEIVMFRTADDPPLYFVKRVIALPGETIAINRGVVTINGQRLPEPYTTINAEWQLPPTTMPANKIYAIGDNRELGPEDYVLGPVATRLVKARLVWYWRWKK